MEVKILRWDRPVIPDESQLRAELIQEGYSVFKWADSAGTTYSPHEHDHHESIWVIEGEMEFEIDQEKIRLRPGDRLFLPKDTTHTAVVPGPENCFYLVGQKE